MERATALLHVFYAPTNVSQQDRKRAHDELVALLRQPATCQDAARYIAAATNAPHDPVAVFYACTALEELARAGLADINALRDHVNLLVEFIVAMYRTQAMPQHVVVKAARAAVAFGRREWAAAGNADAQFPRTVLRLIGQEAASPNLLPAMFAGTSLLTVLVDDALDPRSGMLAAESKALTSNLRLVASDVLAALETGMRIKGPGLPDAVPLAAARSVASVVRVHPPAASDAAALLRRCVATRADAVSAEMMAVLADLYSETNVRLNKNDCEEALTHAAALLEAVAMGDAAKENGEAAVLFRVRLVAYAEAVARRVIALGVPLQAMERLFNGLMGTSIRWADSFPDHFPAALDAWIAIFEAIDYNDVDTDGKLVQSVLQALSTLCVNKARFATNAQVLENLPEDDDEDADVGIADSRQAATDPNITEFTLKAVQEWDHIAERVDTIAANTAGISNALMTLAVRGEQPDGVGADDDIVGNVSRQKYINKCVEALVMAAQFSLQSVALPALQLAVETLKSKPIANAGDREIVDLITATNIAYSICQIVPSDSPPSRAVIEAVVSQLRSAVAQQNTHPQALFGLLHIAAVLASVLAMDNTGNVDQFKKSNAEALAAVAVAVLEKESLPKVAFAAAFLLLALVQNCGTQLFGAALPYQPAFAPQNRHIRPVCALMAIAVVQWTLVNRSPRREKWNDDEKNSRTQNFAKACEVMFGEFVRVCRDLGAGATGARLVEIARGSALLRTVVGALLESIPQGKEMLWVGAARELSKCCLEAMNAIKVHCAKAQKLERSCLLSVMACLMDTIRTISNVCTRQVKREANGMGTHAVELCVDVATGEGSSRLARVSLKLLSDYVGSVGYGADRAEIMRIIEASVQMAGRALAESDDSDLGCTAVSVLAEVINRQWLTLWPEDAVKASNTRDIIAANGDSLKRSHDVYFRALEAVVAALRRPDLAVSRTTLLALESLNASRKLYSRDASFRACGAAESTLVGAFEILGATGDDAKRNLNDEATSVVWGIASVDLPVFYNRVLAKVMRTLTACSEDEANAMSAVFAGVSDRPSFVKALDALCNDLALYSKRKRAPTL